MGKMKISSLVLVLLTKSFLGEECEALNVTVTPGPVVMCPEGSNVTLACRVSQRRRASGLLVVRWLFARQQGETEQLIVKLNMRKGRIYGNYTWRFAGPKLRLLEEDEEGRAFSLLVTHVAPDDVGRYICRVQEIRKLRGRWRASSNGTAAAELRVYVPQTASSSEGIRRLLKDVYLCAVLICSVGLACVLLFLAITSRQYLQRKRRLKASYNLVKSPQNSSEETVTSVIGSSPGLPRKQTAKEAPSGTPPDIPTTAAKEEKMRRPKLVMVQPRKAIMPKITEESLTYAELELVKPQADAKAAVCTGTVYAQILFQEKQM